MDNPSPPVDAAKVMEHVYRATGGIELKPDESREIHRFVSDEIRPLLAPSTSYFIIGSYRNPYIKRLRKTAHKLRKHGAYTVLLGDTHNIDTSRLPNEDIMFQLVGVYSDYIVAIYEKGSGGETVEIGEIDDPPFFSKSHVYVRDYAPSGSADEPFDVVRDALENRFNTDLSDTEREQRLRYRISNVEDVSDIDEAQQIVEEIVNHRFDKNATLASYSWPHKNKFKKFALQNRLYPWIGLKHVPGLVVRTVPGPN